MIEFNCPKCGEAISSPDSLVGMNETCPTCGDECQVPGHPSSVVRPSLASEAQPVFEGIPLLKKAWFRWLLVGGILVAGLASYGRPPSVLVPISYACFGIVAGVVAWKAVNRIKWIPAGIARKGITAGVVLIVLAVAVGKDRYYERRLCSDGQSVLMTTYRRWGDVPLERYYHDEYGSCWGPVSPSGKPHGRWKSVGANGQSLELWYWYGEEVTEGQFRRYERGG